MESTAFAQTNWFKSSKLNFSTDFLCLIPSLQNSRRLFEKVKNIEIKNVSKITRGDGTTIIAPHPARILKIKPKAMQMASIISIFLR